MAVMSGFAVAGLGGALMFIANPAFAGTRYQTSLVPVIDGAGLRVTTDGVSSADDYSIEVDFSSPATAGSGTLVTAFDRTNGNGKFSLDFSNDPVISAAAPGDRVDITAVRVNDGAGGVIGGGGFALK